MLASKADGEPMPGFGEQSSSGPQTLADLAPRVRLGLAGWVIGVSLVVAVAAFFIVVVCLGVANS
ncbi:MAG: hypothetical protein ACYDEA_01235 [Candidatus Dormibacteria bacterium]